MAKSEGPAIQEVVVERSAFELAIQRGLEEPTEVAFFMVGLIRKGVAYVYDLVEFDYKERTAVSIRSGTERKARIGSMLPIGLQLIGNIHKHPSEIGPVPSWQDREMFLSYARAGGAHAFIIYTVEPVEARAYTVHDEQVVEIGLEVRELREDERLISFQLLIPVNVRICVQKGTSLLELRALLSSKLPTEVEKQISPLKLFSGGREVRREEELLSARVLEGRPLKPVDVEVSWTPGLIYRLYVDEDATDEDIEDILRRALGPDIRVVGN